jgi:hypothetical protein
LSSGTQVTLRVTRAAPGADILIEIDPHQRAAVPPRRDSTPVRSRAERVDHQITEARSGQTSLSVVGERGTGRTTLLKQLMVDAEPVTFDGVELVYEPEIAWLERVVQTLDSAEHPVVIENVHLLSPPAARATRIAFERTSAWFALSSDPLQQLSSDVFALVDSSATAVAVLPLRLRKHEIPALVQSILTELSSTVRFTPAALRTLLTHNWQAFGLDSQ